ncbi:hypothetical protein LZ32DRAFT_611020, partial [Colletotrichum eremochloae]
MGFCTSGGGHQTDSDETCAIAVIQGGPEEPIIVDVPNSVGRNIGECKSSTYIAI